MTDFRKCCPFCAAPALQLEDAEDADDRPFVRCMSCDATGPLESSGYTWNDRRKKWSPP